MALITVANLKGGVGKTSLTVNTAHALAKRFGEILIVDLDPQGDASALLKPEVNNTSSLLKKELISSDQSLAEKFIDLCTSAISEVRSGLYLLPLNVVCANFQGISFEELLAQKTLISGMLEQLSFQYDQVLIDTPPYFSPAHEVALSISPLTVVPIDPSEMSVRAAIRLANNIVNNFSTSLLLTRTLVNRQATRIGQRTLKEINISEGKKPLIQVKNNKYLAPKKVSLKGVQQEGVAIFLANHFISRSEQAHLLTYQHWTVFEQKKLIALQNEYLSLARDIEEVLAIIEPEVEGKGYDLVENFF